MLISKILEEIENIPEDQLPELDNIIHDFRLSIHSTSESPRTPGRLKGTLGEAFFDPLPELELSNTAKLSLS
ncbi:MAG: hypothetical protein QNJ37_18945 [Crocosphaera sp.]|nr:hypothetical protein [Crocosphaera sp.]